jgi:hypothetical protein
MLMDFTKLDLVGSGFKKKSSNFGGFMTKSLDLIYQYKNAV